MKILLLSFYYPPDLSAGSFRMGALVAALQKARPDIQIEIYTTLPNRYHSYQTEAPEYEDLGQVKIYRKKIRSHKSGFFDQALSFSSYFFWVLRQTQSQHYDLVLATSSRLFTAFLGAIVRSKQPSSYLALDIRDIFSDTMRSLLSPLPRSILVPLFQALERFTLKKATFINFVSPAFCTYYEKLLQGKIVTTYTNGIDDCFLNYPFHPQNTQPSKLKILYAGNIGAGQGLIDILPQAAKALSDTCEFQVVGAGGQEQVFREAIQSIPNISLRAPIAQKALPQLYDETDVLFLHLADCEAFKKVLPSKIFEYAASGKIMVAGVAGYAAQFLKEQVPGCHVFHPGDVAALTDILKNLAAGPLETVDRKKFIQTYGRAAIMDKLAQAIISAGIPAKKKNSLRY